MHAPLTNSKRNRSEIIIESQTVCVCLFSLWSSFGDDVAVETYGYIFFRRKIALSFPRLTSLCLIFFLFSYYLSSIFDCIRWFWTELFKHKIDYHSVNCMISNSLSAFQSIILIAKKLFDVDLLIFLQPN